MRVRPWHGRGAGPGSRRERVPGALSDRRKNGRSAGGGDDV